ncbi:MAG: 3-deoxy-D-manno-octulosonic-acid transferase [Myxococcota bacterium]
MTRRLLTSVVVHGASFLLLPLVLLSIGIAVAARPARRRGLGQRLGGQPQQSASSIWVHGASMGEARATASLLEQIAKKGYRGFATSVTASGLDVLRRSAPSHTSAFAPLDFPWFVARALSRVKPLALVLIETELWPVLLLSARSRGIPVFIASGRISDTSLANYQRFRSISSFVLRGVDGVAARSQLDADRFVALGVPADRVSVLGDLKLDPAVTRAHLATDLVRATSLVPIFIAGSTHPGEEQAALDALAASERNSAGAAGAALVIAPRHLNRCDEVVRTIVATGRRLLVRSELAGAQLAAGDVLLLDTVGELAALYAAASVAFVGGTLAPVGGHNVLEPLFEGCPVVFGPNTEDARDSARLAIECGAGTQIASAEALGDIVSQLLADPKECRARGTQAKGALETNRGSAGRLADWLEEQLRARDRSAQ